MPQNRLPLKAKLEKSSRMVLFVSLALSFCLVYFLFKRYPTSNVVLIVLALSGLLTLITSKVMAIKTSKDLIDPILTIKKGAEIIGGGNFDYSITLQTNDELQDLAETFNSMAKKLRGLSTEQTEEKTVIGAERNKFLVVIDSVLDGIITLDYNRKISLVNKSASLLMGLSEEDMVGKKFDELILIFKNKTRLSSLDFCPLTPVNEDRVIFQDKSLKMVTPKKELFISMTSSSIKEGKLANLGCVIIFRDSSKEREADEMKIDFVSMAAHELRTPLTTIRGYASLLEPKIIDKITKEEMGFLQRVNISANQLSALVENLLDVSKIEHGNLVIDPKETDWTTLVDTTVKSFDEMARQKGVELKFTEPPQKLPPVFVDAFRIAEVISNLVANALTYSKEKAKVEVKAYEDKGMVVTSIKDNGIGIPEDSLSHLFTKFYRVSGALEQGSKGTGLGLFISKSIVNLHKGDIWVESELGVGSTFYFSVPIFKG